MVWHSVSMSSNSDITKKCNWFFEEKYGFLKCLLASSNTDVLEICAILCEFQPDDEVIKHATNNAHMYYMACPSLHSCGYYKNKHDGRVQENCDKYGECIVRLLLYNELTDDEVKHVIKKILEFSYS